MNFPCLDFSESMGIPVLWTFDISDVGRLARADSTYVTENVESTSCA